VLLCTVIHRGGKEKRVDIDLKMFVFVLAFAKSAINVNAVRA